MGVHKAQNCFLLHFSGTFTRLSGQELFDCVTTAAPHIHGCLFLHLGKWHCSQFRLSTKVPPNGRNCRQHRKQPHTFIREYHLLLPDDQENLKVAVATIGPASISIKFTENCFLYKTGIFMTTFVKTTTRSQLIPCYLWAIFFRVFFAGKGPLLLWIFWNRTDL